MLYRPGVSPLHRANPLTKLALILPVAAMLPLWPAPVLLAVAALAVAAGFAAGIGPALLRRLLLLMAPIAIALGVVHGLLIARGPAAVLGPLTWYPEGIAQAALIFARLAALLGTSLLVVMTTRPGDIAKALDGAGLPPSVSYVLTAPLQLVDSIANEARAISDALQVRGLSSRSGLRARMRLLAALVGPLVRGMLTDTPARAQALDGRGFRAHPRRSVLAPVHDSPAQRRTRWGLVALAAGQFVAALA